MAVWAIDGATSPASVARVANFHAVKGEAGIILPTDHQVTALPTPGGAVLVSPGGASLINTYVEGAQNYLTGDDTAVTVPVTATGTSGGAVRYVVKTVRDPQYAGVTLDSRGYDFFDVVDSNALVTYGHPYYAFARIDQPASTATITDAMITPLQKVANPLTHTEMRPRMTLSAGAEVLGATGTDGEWFPNAGGEQQIYIPTWATKAIIKGEWLDVRYAASSNPSGQHWVEYGPYARPSTRERSTQRGQHDATAAGNTDRRNWFVRDVVDIPESYRGTTQTFVLKARTNGDIGASIDGLSGVNLEVIFQMVATPSTS